MHHSLRTNDSDRDNSTIHVTGHVIDQDKKKNAYF